MHHCIPIPLLFVTGLVACTDAAAPIPSSSTPVAPGVASASRAATVTRFPAWYTGVLVDEQRHLTAIAGVPFEQLVEICAEGTGLFTFDPAIITTVRRPDGSLAVLWKAKDVNLVVFSGEFPDDYCAAYYATAPLATGLVHATFHDNDFSVSRNRTDSYHYDLSGTGFYAETGEPVRFSVKMQGLIARDGSIKKRNTRIRLRP